MADDEFLSDDDYVPVPLTATIVKIYPTRIWTEKDIMGTVHIKMQHEGCEAFDFIQIRYDYAYTSNSHQAGLTYAILKLLEP